MDYVKFVWGHWDGKKYTLNIRTWKIDHFGFEVLSFQFLLLQINWFFCDNNMRHDGRWSNNCFLLLTSLQMYLIAGVVCRLFHDESQKLWFKSERQKPSHFILNKNYFNLDNNIKTSIILCHHLECDTNTILI